MGRNTTTAQSVESACKLDLRIMLKDGSIQKDMHLGGTISWKYGGEISFESKLYENEKYVRVMYSTTDRKGNKVEYDYKIKIVSVPSNLKKGAILYFECPTTGRRARVLCSAYGNDVFVHREYYKEVYGRRLFYDSQRTSKAWYNNTMYFNYKKRVESFEKFMLTFKQWKRTYRGKETRHFKRLRELKEKKLYHDMKRCQALQKSILKVP
jgi:hypothetical protein